MSGTDWILAFILCAEFLFWFAGLCLNRDLDFFIGFTILANLAGLVASGLCFRRSVFAKIAFVVFTALAIWAGVNYALFVQQSRRAEREMMREVERAQEQPVHSEHN